MCRHWKECSTESSLIEIRFHVEILVKYFSTKILILIFSALEFKCCAGAIPYYKIPKKTRGLGDNISGTGIVYHKYLGKRSI